jgi:hypothetical protein
MLKLDGTLRTDSPALAASGALGHIVFERSPAALISNTQCRSRTILYTGQTPVAVFVYAKVGHVPTLMMLRRLFKNTSEVLGPINTDDAGWSVSPLSPFGPHAAKKSGRAFILFRLAQPS